MAAVVAVTGASGFIGRTLCSELRSAGNEVLEIHRRAPPESEANARRRVICGDFERVENWGEMLRGVGHVVHLAARVHEVGVAQADERSYDAINCDVTLALARASAEAGVRRFVFASTIKVNGEETTERPFRADDAPNPRGAYARSKWHAEQTLHTLARETGLATTIIRPPLVYGAGVGGNFRRLLTIARRRLPVPIGAIQNARSIVNVWNLCDLIAHCLRDARATNRTFLVSDGEDVSTPELLRRIARTMDVTLWLPPVPPFLLTGVGAAFMRSVDVHRLTSSLRVDMTPTCETLSWQPPCRLDEGLRRTVAWFKDRESR